MLRPAALSSVLSLFLSSAVVRGDSVPEGYFSSANVELMLGKDAGGYSGWLRYKGTVYDAKGALRGESVEAEFTDGKNSWTCVVDPKPAGVEFSTGGFREKLERKTSKVPAGEYASKGAKLSLTGEGAGRKGTLETGGTRYDIKIAPGGDLYSGTSGDGGLLLCGLVMEGGRVVLKTKSSTDHLDAVQPAPVTVQTISTLPKQELQVSCDKEVYEHGDVMKVKVILPSAGFLRLYGVSADGSTALLFPNRWTKDDKVSKGEFSLPAADAPYDFTVSLDKGQTRVTETLHAVFSPQRFADSGEDGIKFGNAKFESLGVTNAEQRSTRGLVPTARPQVLSSELKYNIGH